VRTNFVNCFSWIRLKELYHQLGTTILITPQQCRAARAGLDWTRDELAQKAGVGLSTVASFEREEGSPRGPNLAAIRLALEKVGVRFTEDGCVCFPEAKKGAAE
jgi:transcriptional regulator with XRE-family HTH domain